jgi:hypothetical protein
MTAVPALTPTADPNELIVTTAGSLDCQSIPVRSRDDPSANDPVARNATTPPTAMSASRGDTETASSRACSLELEQPIRISGMQRTNNFDRDIELKSRSSGG